MQVVLFDVGEIRCALSRAEVARILPVPRLWRPPGLPAVLAGFANLGGRAVGVVALERLFDTGDRSAPITPERDLYRHLILVEGGATALLVDRVLDMTEVPPERVQPARGGETLNDCVVGEIAQDGGLVPLVTVERLLLAREREGLAELGQAAQARLAEWGAAPE